MTDEPRSTLTTPCLRLVDRLRGIYTIPVNDGLGLLNGKDTFTPAEPFFTPPIQKEAASRIEELESAAQTLIDALDHSHARGETFPARVSIAASFLRECARAK